MTVRLVRGEIDGDPDGYLHRLDGAGQGLRGKGCRDRRELLARRGEASA